VVSRAFPVADSRDVDKAAAFWELLGFERGERIASVADADGNPVALCAVEP